MARETMAKVIPFAPLREGQPVATAAVAKTFEVPLTPIADKIAHAMMVGLDMGLGVGVTWPTPPDRLGLVLQALADVTAELSRLRAEFAEFRRTVTLPNMGVEPNHDVRDRARRALEGLACVREVRVRRGDPNLWIVFTTDNAEGSDEVTERLLSADIDDFHFVPSHAASMVDDAERVV